MESGDITTSLTNKYFDGLCVGINEENLLKDSYLKDLVFHDCKNFETTKNGQLEVFLSSLNKTVVTYSYRKRKVPDCFPFPCTFLESFCITPTVKSVLTIFKRNATQVM